MDAWIMSVLTGAGLSGWKADVLASVIFTSTLMLSVLAIGAFIGWLDRFLVRMTSGVSGEGIARFILNRVMFVGTVHHELSHALFGVLTGVEVKKIRCFVLFSKDKLGYVEFVPRGGRIKKAVQLALVSCAPVMTGLVTVPALIWVAAVAAIPVWARVMLGYCALSVLCHMSMSRADLKLYGQGAVFVFPMLFVIIMCVRYFLL